MKAYLFVLALAGLLASPAQAGEDSQIHVDVAESGMVVIGGRANSVLNNLNGEFVIPVQVATGCGPDPSVAWVVARAQLLEDGPSVLFSIEPTRETLSTCETQWLARLSEHQTKFPLFAGDTRITADNGALKGLSVTISSSAGRPLPDEVK